MKTVAALALLAAVLPAFAGTPADRQDKAKKRELKDRVESPGSIVCIGCTLENGSGADAQCTLHSRHAQGLLAPDGILHTFVDNTKGHIVMTNEKLRNREVSILGWRYPKSNYIEVSKYRLKDGEKWVAYDYCKTCGFEPGDHHDTDLCDDCKE